MWPRPLTTALVAVLLALLGTLAPVALASPEAVLEDYYADGVVDGVYTVDDLSRALSLARAQEEAQYANAASAIEIARSQALAGLRTPGGDGPAKDGLADGDGGARAQEVVRSPQASVPSALPVPPVVQPGAGVPWPFVALSVLAVLLVLGGVTASALRRLRTANRG